MIAALFLVVVVVVLPHVRPQSEQADHRDFQYNSVVDPNTGRYNFAYDTGHDNDIAHSLHMQYQDADGIVRGRYGYTDPRGQLRMVEYEAGPDGFVARGDVGPDQFPHDQAPAQQSPSGDSGNVLSSYRETSGNDFDLDPAPVQMAGWDPEGDPIEQAQPDNSVSGSELSGLDQSQLATVNVTSENALELYGPELGFYSDGYPRIVYAAAEGNIRSEPEAAAVENGTQPQKVDPSVENNALNIYNIDVDPDEIRATSSGTVRRSADVRPEPLVQQESGHAPVRVTSSYSTSRRPTSTHDHDAEVRARQTHDAERRSRYTHDHDAERRLGYRHDHDAERRLGYIHDHDAQGRSRYIHDHYVEGRGRYTHDHDPERYRSAYYRTADGKTYYYPRRIFYRDSHSMQPHEHNDNPVYRNHRDHQHSDVQLYGRYRNYAYPATETPSHLRYIPSDKYHNKYYYWRDQYKST